MSQIIYKDRADALVTDDDAPGTRAVSAKSAPELVWWQWVDQRLDARLATQLFNESQQEVLAGTLAEIRDGLKAEIASLRRELGTLQREVELKLNLKTELDAARGEIEELRQRAPSFKAQIDSLREQNATQDKLIRKLRAETHQLDYEQREQDKAVRALRREAKAASTELELETSTTRFRVKKLHPDAAAALCEFAGQVLDSRDGRTIGLLAHPAGTA